MGGSGLLLLFVLCSGAAASPGIRARPQLYGTLSTLANKPHLGRRALVLRGGFDPLAEVSPIQISKQVAIDLNEQKAEPMDASLFEGDVQRLFQGAHLDETDQEKLTDQFSHVSDQVHLTQQFLILQDIRINDQMPGGANCSYADSWFTGALWEKSDDEFQWTRSAWLQCQRAQNWQEMPSVWKRIMRNAWEDLQDFLAMLSLPDGGTSTARYAEHEQAWEQVQAAYMSNINRRTEELANGGLQAEVDARRAAAQPYIDAKCREQQVQTIFEWLGYKSEHMVRQIMGSETTEDAMKQFESVEVQLFGIPLFNTKDPVSERLWSMGASQGETVTGWPLKAAAWIAKKMERVGTISLPPEAPMTSESHVLLGNTRYHNKYKSGEVDKRRSNALERLHSYVTSNFVGRNSSVWNSIKEDFEEDVAASAESGELPIMTARSYKALEAEQRERLDIIATELQATNATDAGLSGDDALASMLASLSIRDARKAVETVFDNHGGGELRMTALALNISIPASFRDWLDDPYADEAVMIRLLRHPRVEAQLTNPDILPEPEIHSLE